MYAEDVRIETGKTAGARNTYRQVVHACASEAVTCNRQVDAVPPQTGKVKANNSDPQIETHSTSTLYDFDCEYYRRFGHKVSCAFSRDEKFMIGL